MVNSTFLPLLRFPQSSLSNRSCSCYAHRPISPPAYTERLALTSAARTGLSCSVSHVPNLSHPIPRGNSPAPSHPEVPALETRPSPWHERLGSPIVFLSRLQTSPDAATGLISPCLSRALATTLATATLRYQPEVCYPALTGAGLPPPGEIQRAFAYVSGGPTTGARIRTHHDNNTIL